MEIIFNEEYLREMYNTGRTDKKHRFQPQIIRKYIRVIRFDAGHFKCLGVNAIQRIELREIERR